jgi:hypothetical protein
MQSIRRLSTLNAREIRDLAANAAERGERIKDVCPFPRGSISRRVFSRAFAQRAAELRPFAS